MFSKPNKRNVSNNQISKIF